MNDNQKFLTGLVLGAAAGAAIALFLSGEKGREILSQVKDIAEDTTSSVKEKLSGFESDVQDLLGRGKKFASDLESKASEGIA